MSLCSLASYLASLNAPVVAAPGATSPHESNASDSPSSSSLEGSPAKRARAESPDTSIASSSPAEYFSQSAIIAAAGSMFSSGKPTTLLTASNLFAASAPSPTSGCPALRSILTASFTPLHSKHDGPSSAGGLSEPTSRPLSRRSSTGASSTNNKSVRFARCTNASVFPALGVDEYDRSPIVPTCESESLELPKRQNREEDGWIKCVERERAAAAKRVATGQALPAMSPSMENPVEGKHGLIEGGYFVGEERDEQTSIDEEDDMMVVDDQETGEDRAAPALIQDDSSGDDDSDGILSINSDQSTLNLAASRSGGHAPIFTASPISETDLLKHATLNAAICAAITSTMPVIDLTPTGSPAVLSTATFSSAAESEDAKAVESSADEASAEEGDDEAAAAAARIQREKKEKAKKCRERYGLCALGKYSRAEVFSSYDSLGGF